MQPPAPLPIVPPAAPQEETAFIARHFRRNTRLYLTSISLSALTGSFGDMSMLVPSLVLKLNGPRWLSLFPMVAIMSLAYVPAIIMGWVMRPDTSRVRLYSFSILSMFLPLLIPSTALLLNAGRTTLIGSIFIGCALAAIGQGLTILPCWDLFARIFPQQTRGTIIGWSTGLAQLLNLVASIAVALLVGANSTALAWLPDRAREILAGWSSVAPFPRNYGISLLINITGGLVCATVLRRIKEYRHPHAGPRLPIRQYLGELRAILQRDTGFRRLLAGTVIGASLTSSMPLLLLYAVSQRGFTPDRIPLLLPISASVFIPVALLFGHLAAKIGPHRIAALCAGLVIAGWSTAMVAHNGILIVALIAGNFASTLYTYQIVAIMNHAPAGQTHRYLTLFYAGALVMGLTPLALNALLPLAPQLVPVAVITLATVTGSLLLMRSKHGEAAAEGTRRNSTLSLTDASGRATGEGAGCSYRC
ncbi:MAG: MFS transporter [Lentisphaerae bacterium]|nr:MFS transporter [Lentisphaerota bacterium]